MIEIILIWRLIIYIGEIAYQKCLKQTRYQIMAVLLWICGEFLGSILGLFFFRNSNSYWLTYGIALIGGIAGAGIAFLIMRFLPNKHEILGSTDSKNKQEIPRVNKFGGPIWVPLITILLAISCVCLAFGASAIIKMRSSLQQIQASNPVIGIEIDDSGQITQPTKEISSKENAIYFGFDFANPSGDEIPVTFNWSINNNNAFSFSKTLNQGQVIVALDRKVLELPEFNKGDYEVKAYIGELFLTSASFVVK
jgi:hypothetical protein